MDVTYGYDLDGKVTRTVELNSYSYTYSYEARGRFEKITDALTGQLQYQYYLQRGVESDEALQLGEHCRPEVHLQSPRLDYAARPAQGHERHSGV